MIVEGTEVLIDGDGPSTMVMVHGWPDTAALWAPQVAHFRDRFRCVRFTLPGFDVRGLRQRPTLDAMVAHLAAIVDAASPDAPVTLMLHDWGAVYGYTYAMRHPARVARIVGIDVGETASGEFLRSLSLRAKLMIAAYQGWLALAWHLPRGLGDRMTRWMARRMRAPGDPATIGATMNHPYVSQFAGGFRGSPRVRPTCPMLFVYGTRKPFMFHAEAWTARIAASPGGAVRPLPAGHWVMVNRPTEFHRAVDDWLGG